MAAEFEGARTAIVTGGARRIGAAIARALSADGWHLLIHCNRSLDEAEALAAELRPITPNHEILVARFGPVILTHVGPGALGVAIFEGERPGNGQQGGKHD